MNISDQIKVRGEIEITSTNKKGEVTIHSQPNLITSEGLAFFCSKIFDKNSRTYSTVGAEVVNNLDTVNYYVSDISVGTDNSEASLSDTYYTTNDLGTKLRNSITDEYINESDSSFYFQAMFKANTIDTITDANDVAQPIKEVLLIAKSDYIPNVSTADEIYDSPTGSIANPKKLIARTVLTQPFTKYATDRVVVTWKIKLG